MSNSGPHSIGVLAAIAGLSGCGDDAAANTSGLIAEMQAFEDETNQKAREACGAPDNVAELEGEDGEGAPCYFELAVNFHLDDCTERAYAAHAEATRAQLACARERSAKMFACCNDGGACDYGVAETCTESIAAEVTCKVDTSLRDAIEKCTNAKQNGSPKACTGGAGTKTVCY